jgi:DNA-binding transcriptional ArsR family regulator
MSLLPSRGPKTSTAQEGDLQVVGVDEDVAPVFDALSSDTARDVLNAIYDEPGTPSEIASRLDMSIQKVSYHLENLADVDLIEVAGTRYSEKGREMTVYEPPDDPLVVFVGTEERKRTLRSLVKRVVPTLGILAVASAAIQSAFGGGLGLSLGSGEEPRYGDQAPPEEGGEVTAGPTDESAMEGAETPTARGDGGGNGGGNVATETPVSTDSTGATPTPEATGTPTSSGDIGIQATGEPTPTAQPTATPTDAIETLASTPGGAVDTAAVLEPGIAFFLGGLFALAIVGAVWYVRNR